MNALFGFAPWSSPNYQNMMDLQQRAHDANQGNITPTLDATFRPDLLHAYQIADLAGRLNETNHKLDLMAQQIAQLAKTMPIPQHTRQAHPRVLPPFEVATS